MSPFPASCPGRFPWPSARLAGTCATPGASQATEPRAERPVRAGEAPAPESNPGLPGDDERRDDEGRGDEGRDDQGKARLSAAIGFDTSCPSSARASPLTPRLP